MNLEFYTDLDGELVGFIDSVCTLIQGRPLEALINIDFREVESFLRDENHIPCFSSEPSSFSLVKEVIEDLFWTFLTPRPNVVLSSDADYLSQLNALTSYFDEQWNENKLVLSNRYNLEFVSLENDLIILDFVKTTDENVKLILCEKLEKIMMKILNRKNVKVVAEK